MPDLELSPSPLCPITDQSTVWPRVMAGTRDITILSVAPDQIWYLYTPSDHQAAGSLTKPSVIGTKCLTKCGFSFLMAVTIIEAEAPNECVISQFLYPGNWFPEREETLASDTVTPADFIIITEQQIISHFKINFINVIFSRCRQTIYTPTWWVIYGWCVGTMQI